MTTQATLWTATALSLFMAAAATLAERRRDKRRNLDKVGWVPWPLVQIAGAFGSVICAVLALKI